MSSIKVLPDNLINKIAAGEVVERPASVVKELIENAVDAGATEVLVDIEQAGRRLIRVADNGSGMSPEDAALAFARHATSKIAAEADLEAIRTMGFRGEALASIAAVSQVRLLTARQGSGAGVLIEIDGGAMKAAADAASPPGTMIEVHHLFYNTPARLKFLKSAATELSHILSAVSHQAMARPAIRFKLTHNRKTLLDLPPSDDLAERAVPIFGSELSGNLMSFSGGRDAVQVHGLIGRPNYDRGDRACQEFYVNGRHVRNASLTHALYQAYRDLLMRDRHPVGLIFIDLDPALVDVNVHPAKAEVRFRNQAQIHDLVRDAVREALEARGRSAGEAAASRGPEDERASADRVRDAAAGFAARNAQPLHDQQSHAGGRRSYEHPLPFGERLTVLEDAATAFRSDLASRDQLVPLAQVHDSFIIAQSNDGMALIDQHAAHERVLYEKLQDQLASGSIPVQELLIPVQVETGHAERELLAEYLPRLTGLGFHVEEFGGGTFVIKAIPALMTGGDYRRLLLDIIDELKVHGRTRKIDELRDEVLSVMACHPAIKVHRKLTMPEMEGLIGDLFACRMPHSCPHGRPTVVQFSMDEIRRMFKRT